MIKQRYPLGYYLALAVVATHVVVYSTCIGEIYLEGAVKLAAFLFVIMTLGLIGGYWQLRRYHLSLLMRRPEIRNLRLFGYELWPETISKVDSDKSDFR